MFLAQLLFWVSGVLVIAVQATLVMRKGPWDLPSSITAGLVLLAGLLGLVNPRAKSTYLVGGIALIALTARTGLAAWDLVQLQHHESRLPQLAPYPGIAAILLAWLTLLYCFGKSSRAYFSMK